MNSGPFPQPYPLLFLVLPILFLNYFPPCLSITDWFSICNTTKFSCGNITGVDFPFWGNSRPDHCGYPHLKLDCSRNITTIEIGNVTYLVLNINQTAQTLKILRSDLRNGVCSPQFGDTAFDTKQFEYAPDSGAIHLFYDCANKNSLFLRSYFTCADGSTHRDGYVLVDSGETETGICNSSVTIGLQRSYYWIIGNSSSINQAVREGFQLKYRADSKACKWCASYGGACGYNSNSTEFSCLCKPPIVGPICNSEAATAPDKHGSSSKRKWVIGISVPLFGLITTSIMIAYAFKKGNLVFWKKDDRNEFDVEAFIRSSKSLAPTRYSYSSVKKMTNSFAEEIGRGGFGSVYKGKLGDGRLVAVKVLNETKDNGEDFINEVASIGNTSHVNIVTLVGFCYGRAKRALIYEFMPNGSLDKFIFSAESTDDRSLEWKVLFDITVGIARGLEYLHRGCKTRILHFDIKPQNILLDKNFCPKISDFGLAKLWLRKESVMSTIEARGTAGYIAPEVFNRNYGGVSHKSDVYSYGMLVLEMVGGRKNFDAGVSQSSEVYYPHWIYKQTIELGNCLTSLGVTTDEENEMSRKMVLVGFWCIQTNPADRPSMSKVVEMLEGSVESLDIPPKPFLFSPTVSPQRST